MILSYRDKRTERFAQGNFTHAFQAIDRQAYRRLEILQAATSLNDLRALPNNRIETLRVDRRGQWSVRINDQWRICFQWSPDATGPSNVKITDDH